MRLCWTEKKHLWAICVVLAVFTGGVYYQVLGFGFVNYDDPLFIKNTHATTGLTSENMAWAFRFEQTTQAANWTPLTWLSLMLDAELFGKWAPGFHLTNLAWHIGSVWVLFLLLWTMTRATYPSAFTAAVFAVHPLHVESVAWVAERRDVLSVCFGLLAILAYVQYARTSRGRWFLVAASLFACSLLSKQTLVTLPFLLLLLDYWPLGRFQRSADQAELGTSRPSANQPLSPAVVLVVEKVPLFALTLLFSYIALASQTSAGTVSSLQSHPLDMRLANACLAYVGYMRQTIWPTGLNVFYPYFEDGIPWAMAAGAALSLAAISVWVMRRRKAEPYLLVGWFWFLGTLVPVIGLVQIGAQRMADRYTYFPQIGLVIMLTWWIVKRLPDRRQMHWIAGAVSVAALMGLAVVAWKQTGYWRDSVTLFQRVLAVSENNYRGHSNLGTAYVDAEQMDLASQQFHIALQIKPSFSEAHACLGKLLFDAGRLDEALDHCQAAVELDQDSAMARLTMGMLLHKRGDFEQAVPQFQRAIAAKPHDAFAHYNLGIVAAELNRFEWAEQEFRETLRLDRENYRAMNSLGIILTGRGQLPEATTLYLQAIQLQPDDPLLHFNLAETLAHQGRMREAIKHLHEAVRLKPDFSEATAVLQRIQ